MILCAKQMIPCKSFGLLCMISCSVFLPFGCLVYARNCLFISCREIVWCTSIQQPHCGKEFVLLSELCAAIRVAHRWNMRPPFCHRSDSVQSRRRTNKNNKFEDAQLLHTLSFTQLPLGKLWRPTVSFKRIRYCPGGVRCRKLRLAIWFQCWQWWEGGWQQDKAGCIRCCGGSGRCSRTDGERLGFFSHWTWNGGTVTLSIFFHDLHNAHYNALFSHNFKDIRGLLHPTSRILE